MPLFELGEKGWRWPGVKSKSLSADAHPVQSCPGPSPATMASRSPSLLGRILMNSCRRKGATSVLLLTNIRTGFFKETEAKSLTCQVQGQSCSAQRVGKHRKTAFPAGILCRPLGTPTSSVMVAEKSMVWRWWEHIRIISFICSSKYSSSILEEGERHALLSRVRVKRSHRPRLYCDSCLPYDHCYLTLNYL